MTKRKGQAIRTGVRLKGNKLEAYVRVRGVLYTERFDLGTPVETMDTWRTKTKRENFGGGRADRSCGLAADIDAYAKRNAAKPTRRQILAHLEAWAAALGRDRSRHTIKTEEIDVVMNQWVLAAPPPPADRPAQRRGRPPRATGLDKQTIQKRRNSLRTFYEVMNRGLAGVENPVQKALSFPAPAAGKLEARGTDYATIARVLAAMPDYHTPRKGEAPTTLTRAKLIAAVMAYTGLPPAVLGALAAADLDLAADPATVRVGRREKGGGVEPRTLELNPHGRAAFAAFAAADAWGPINADPVNRSFQKAARRAGVRLGGGFATLYDLRHSFGAQAYRATGDQATVARQMLHAEGSTVTARYTKAAHAEVDRAAAAAFAATIAHLPAVTLAAPPTTVAGSGSGQLLETKVGKRPKLRAVNHLRSVG
jgi:integrase